MDVQLVLLKGASKRQALQLRSEEAIIGRREGCDVRIPSAKVSRRHCRLTMQNDVLMAEDLGSSNGTYVNGALISGLQVVRPGDRLEVGPLTFEVKYPLSPKAVEYLLKHEQEEHVPVVDVPLVDVEELTELQEAPAEEAVSDALVLEETEDQTVPLELADEAPTPSPSKKKKDDEADLVRTEAAELVDEIFDKRDRWKGPAKEDIRDILSQLEE